MLRIIGGDWRGRQIQAPPTQHTRPTSDRVREALFNVLTHRIELAEYRVLDLYAGSGALGIEALSRGASQAVFVEQHGATARLISQNLKRLGANPSRWQVVRAKAGTWLSEARLDSAKWLVLLDPPYGAAELPRVVSVLGGHASLAAESWIVAETPAGAGLQAPAPLELDQVKRYGDTEIAFFIKSSPHAE